jgi:CheY-like chemotaxis protein
LPERHEKHPGEAAALQSRRLSARGHSEVLDAARERQPTTNAENEQNRKIVYGFYRLLTTLRQPARITDAIRETVMHLNLGSLRVTDDFTSRSRVRPGHCCGHVTDDAQPRSNEPLATRGALSEAWLPVGPATLIAPRLPAGLRSRDPTHRTITILLIDDDTVDVIAIRRSFWQLKIANPLVVARNGLEALDILRGDNSHAKLEAPYLILLDLNMARMGGIEFLDELRRDPVLRRTLVFVITASTVEEDRERAYEKNIAGYIKKPATGDGFAVAISALENYWRAIEFPD